MQIVVSISDAKVSANQLDTIITYSLGSCIGVTLYDPARKIGGMLHFQLPSGAMDQARATQAPCMFGDTGMAKLVELMAAAGADKKRLKCKIAGGAKMLADASSFDIGKRNHTSIRKVLWQLGIMIDSEDCGGSSPRTMTLNLASGAVSLKRSGELVTMQ